MEINKNNYEAFLLDLMEGKLSAEEHNALLLFLEKHPEIEFDYDLRLPQVTVDDNLRFDLKNSLKHLDDEREEQVVYYLEGTLSSEEKRRFELQLKRDDSLQNLLKQFEKTKLEPDAITFPMERSELFKFSTREEKLISFSEGLLSEEEAKDVMLNAQSNPSVMNELNLLAVAKSTPDFTINYPNKEELKKSAVIVFLRSSVSYLSIAASLILLFVVFYPTPEKHFEKGLAVLQKQILLKKLDGKSFKIKEVNGSLEVNLSNKQNNYVAKNNEIRNNSKEAKNNQTNFLVEENKFIEELPIAQNKNENLNISQVKPYNPVVINYYDEEDVDAVVKNEAAKPGLGLAQKLLASPWEDEGKITTSNKKEPSKKMNLLAFIGNGLKKLGVKKSGAQKIYNEDDDYVEYNVNIAGITISKKELN